MFLQIIISLDQYTPEMMIPTKTNINHNHRFTKKNTMGMWNLPEVGHSEPYIMLFLLYPLERLKDIKNNKDIVEYYQKVYK